MEAKDMFAVSQWILGLAEHLPAEDQDTAARYAEMLRKEGADMEAFYTEMGPILDEKLKQAAAAT